MIGVEESDALVDSLRHHGDARLIILTTDLNASYGSAGNSRVRYTRYDTSSDRSACDWMVGHNCWDKAYTSQELWDWLLLQCKSV